MLTYDTDLQDGFRPSLTEPGVYVVDFEIGSLPLQPDIMYSRLSST
jgi:hypothetical protein